MLIEDNLKLKETNELINKVLDLLYLQAKEIDLIHFKLFKIEGKYKSALEVLNISKNIEPSLKEKLKDEIKEIQALEENDDGL